jgi:hypothetical protein
MKKNLFLVLSVLSLSTFAAEPIRLNGAFTFDGIEHIQTKDIEIVPDRQPARVYELISQKYTCLYLASFYRCTKLSADRTIPAEIESELKSKYQFERFRFQVSDEQIILTNEAPSITEWDIPDVVRTNKEEIKMYQYFILSSGIHKIKIPFKQTEYILIQNDKKISSHVNKTLKIDRWKTKEFVILVNFTK